METYSITVHCSNCNTTSTLEIPMGSMVGSEVCPHCGCHTVSKSNGPTLEHTM